MKKIRSFLLILAVVVAGFFGYQRWVSSKYAAWQYIPENQLLVIESNHLQDVPKKTDSVKVQLSETLVFEQAADYLHSLSQLSKDSKITSNFLKDKTVLFSLHPESNHRLRFITYVPYSPALDADFIKLLTDSQETNKIRLLSHSYRGLQIWEAYQGEDLLISYLLHDNYLIFSKSSLLVEDVVRKIDQTIDRDMVLSKFQSYDYNDGKFTHLYLDFKNLTESARQVLAGDSPTFMALFEALSSIQNYSFQLTNTGKTVIGQALMPNSEQPLIQVLTQQKSQSIACSRYIPNNTALFMHLAVSDSQTLKDDCKSYLKQHEADWWQEASPYRGEYGLHSDSLFYFIDKEIGLCETENGGKPQYLLLVHSQKAKDCFSFLGRESAQVQSIVEGDVLDEVHLGFPIKQLNVPLPNMLFGRWIGGFDRCFFSVVNDYVIIANEPQALRDALSDISINNVWSNNATAIATLKQTKKAQFSAILNTTKAYSFIEGMVKPQYLPVLSGFEQEIKKIKWGIWQIDQTSRGIEARVLLSRDALSLGASNPNKWVLQKGITLGDVVIKQPFIYQTASRKIGEMLIQTADNRLTALNTNGEMVGVYALSTPILSQFLPFDYHKNGQVQYVAATENRLLVIDRNEETGLDVLESEPFSKLKIERLQLAVSDMNASQLMGTNLRGDFFRFDKQKLTVGNLKQYAGQNHTLWPTVAGRVNEVKRMVVLQENGKLHITNPDGTGINNSPLNLDGLYTTGPYVALDTQTGSYLVNLVSKTGEVLSVDLNGNIKKRIQLPRPAKETTYRLLPEAQNSDWYIVRETGGSLTLMDRNGKDLLQFQNILPNETEVQYYQFGSDVRLILLRTGNETKIFDMNGSLVGGKTLVSDFPISLGYAESYNKLFAYTAKGKAIEIWAVKIK